MSLPARADSVVNCMPVSCMPSPESPAKRMTTDSLSSIFFAGCASPVGGGTDMRSPLAVSGWLYRPVRGVSINSGFYAGFREGRKKGDIQNFIEILNVPFFSAGDFFELVVAVAARGARSAPKRLRRPDRGLALA